jgi:hypothetical protein
MLFLPAICCLVNEKARKIRGVRKQDLLRDEQTSVSQGLLNY